MAILPPTSVHPTSVISPEAEIGRGCQIGPNCVLTGKVTLGENVRLVGNVYIEGPTTIGAGTTIYPFACIGFPPQDYKFKPGAPTAGVVIGRECLIREHVTVHAASKTEHATTAGDRCFLMVASHMGHDSVIGNDVILVNGSLLGGHVRVADRATISGGTGVHQFVEIGRLAFITGGIAQTSDVPPFCMIGARNTMIGLNVVGMRRNGVPREEITLVRRAFREAFLERVPKAEMVQRLGELAERSAYVRELRDFIARKSPRPLSVARLAMQEDAEGAAV
jgi:UDP-N-acetylglucosamine acyltransferase